MWLVYAWKINKKQLDKKMTKSKTKIMLGQKIKEAQYLDQTV
jgi:hypothetical protein